tara:strand:- start:4063 stop:4311 length:249 start_codon:yes stop_codon:yes gene_type:complete
MSIHASPLTEIVRYYEKGSYEDKDPYDLVFTMVWDTSTQVTLHGLKGKMTRDIHKQLASYFKSRGIKSYRTLRHNKWKVTQL